MLADACEIYGQELFDFDIYYFKVVSPNLVLFLGKTNQVASIIWLKSGQVEKRVGSG